MWGCCTALTCDDPLPETVSTAASSALPSAAPLFSDASEAQLDALHDVAAPGGRTVELAGVAQSNRDSVRAIRAAWALALSAYFPHQRASTDATQRVYQRSNSSGFMVRGSRLASASSGLVIALT